MLFSTGLSRSTVVLNNPPLTRAMRRGFVASVGCYTPIIHTFIIQTRLLHIRHMLLRAGAANLRQSVQLVRPHFLRDRLYASRLTLALQLSSGEQPRGKRR